MILFVNPNAQNVEISIVVYINKFVINWIAAKN